MNTDELDDFFLEGGDELLGHSGGIPGTHSLNSFPWPVQHKTKDLLLSDNFVIEEIED